MTTFRPTNTNHPLVGKFYNVAGDICQVTHVNDNIVWLRPVKFPKCWELVGQPILEQMEELTFRTSFNYRPGDKDA